MNDMFIVAARLATLSAGFFLAIQYAHAQGSDIKMSKVTLRVKEVNSWVTTGGTLFKLTDKGRTFAADINANGKLDPEVTCQRNERFEADAESYFDRPTPPPRLPCKEELTFQFARAVYGDWSQASNVAVSSAAVAPFVFSELSLRTLKAGKYDTASFAFSDAAIASTAKLLGDIKMDLYVTRDPNQDYKLVFNDAGVEALRVRQRDAGLKPTGQLDAATQSLFLRGIVVNVKSAFTPAVTCGQGAGLFICADVPGNLPYAARNPVVTLPAFEVKSQ